MTRDEYVKALKDAAVTLGVRLVMEQLVAMGSFFASPFVNFLTVKAVTAIVSILVKYTEWGAFFLYVDFRINQQGNDFSKSVLENQKAKAGGTDEQKQIAEKNLVDSFRRFAKFTT